ncbi:MAG: efflux RND transporter permease subunit [Leadbetterella sp.]|nr:efflux RND transporter permease subunit [Leadbetterella sp.]
MIVSLYRFSFKIILFFVILTFVGFAFIPLLSIQLSPSLAHGSIVISYSQPMASPEVIEQQITSKIEARISTLQGIQKISSVSGYNYGNVNIELKKNTDIDQLRFEVAMALRSLYPSLPKEASYPSIQLNAPDNSQQQESFMTLQFSGNANTTDLTQYLHENIQPKLASIAGIYEINTIGGNRIEYTVKYDLEALEIYGFNEETIVAAIERHFKQESLGRNKTDNSNNNTTVSLKNIIDKDWNIFIGQNNGKLIYLKDLASIQKTEKLATQYYRINGRNALNLIISCEKGVNQIELSNQIRERVIKISREFPPKYTLQIEHDSSEYIKENLQKVGFQAALALVILLVFVGLSIRRWWYMALMVFSLIVNLAIACLFFYIFKIEIHLYSLAALTTSLGLIIDNAIVMIDHYKRHRDLMALTALFGATLTTVAGLVVIFFLPEESQLLLSDFSIVLVITLLASLLVSLFLIPALMEKFQEKFDVYQVEKPSYIKVRLSNLYLKIIISFLKYKKVLFFAAVMAFGLPIFLLPDSLSEKTKGHEIYNFVFANDWFQENLKPILYKTLGGSLRLFVQNVYDAGYYTNPDRTILYINVGLPNNSTLEQMNQIFEILENKCLKYAEVEKCISNIHSAQNGQMAIYFTEKAENEGFAYNMKSIMLQASTEMSGIDWDIYGVGQGFSQNVNNGESSTFNVLMKGYNYNGLERQAKDFKNLLEKHPRIQNVNINKSRNWYGGKNLFEYKLAIDHEFLAIHNISKNILAKKLNNLSSMPTTDIYIFNENQYYPVNIIPKESDKRDIWSLENSVLNIDSARTKMKNIVGIGKQNVMNEIYKENQEYLRTVVFTYNGSNTFGERFLDESLVQINQKMPLGYSAKKQTYNWQKEQKSTQYWLIGLVILLIYLVCAIVFESFLQPLALILIIPLSFIGVFMVFYFFDLNFDQGGYASFILLSGNVVSAAIFIISEYNILKHKFPKVSDLQLYRKAFNHKILPVFLTVFSTIVGLIPFLIFGEKEVFWFAFGVGTIGGLVMSMMVIPVFLPLFMNLKVKKSEFNF